MNCDMVSKFQTVSFDHLFCLFQNIGVTIMHAHHELNRRFMEMYHTSLFKLKYLYIYIYISGIWKCNNILWLSNYPEII